MQARYTTLLLAPTHTFNCQSEALNYNVDTTKLPAPDPAYLSLLVLKPRVAARFALKAHAEVISTHYFKEQYRVMRAR